MILATAATAWAATAGTSEPASGAKPVRSLAEIRNEQVVRQHWDLSCGAAAIATLMTYQLDRPVSERQVAVALLRRTSPLRVRMRLGFSLLDLKRYAADQGFAAEGYGGMTLEDALAMAPLIVTIRANGYRHFVILRGRRGDRLLIADPAFGNRTLTTDAFGTAWVNGIGFVVHSPGQPRPPNHMGAPAELFLQPAASSIRASESSLTGGKGL